MFWEAEFWVAVSFFCFVGIALKMGAGKMLVGPLDDRTKQIASDLAEARRLRDEAEALLKAYEAKRVAAEAEAQAIVDNARTEAERAAEEAHARLTDFIARRTKAAEAKIAQAETQATADVKTAAAEAAVRAAEEILRGSLKGKTAERLFEESLNEVRTQIH
ncbi:F-type H+-transporting ATPase subunit b [Pseudochelatococcus lubricantis]|uniref:ATP synthase subunit b n=1 Tax=Pseudochelatococcus lubricantis TaxID=1538102 RepID=A0ABX0V0C6_9HYPH|nr:ATP F0F1 synthase subunit B [Pseudochelatococcus lubricantis]NIJ57280.1 F-type H+-transporting ATPase subunit b [Pseudochelatococcus lubricantis]